MDRLRPTSRSNMLKLASRALNVSYKDYYESMKPAQTNTSSASAFRIVLTRDFLSYLSTHYDDVAPYYFANYEHEMHQHGVDLINVSEEDVNLLTGYYRIYFTDDNKS